MYSQTELETISTVEEPQMFIDFKTNKQKKQEKILHRLKGDLGEPTYTKENNLASNVIRRAGSLVCYPADSYLSAL